MLIFVFVLQNLQKKSKDLFTFFYLSKKNVVVELFSTFLRIYTVWDDLNNILRFSDRHQSVCMQQKFYRQRNCRNNAHNSITFPTRCSKTYLKTYIILFLLFFYNQCIILFMKLYCFSKHSTPNGEFLSLPDFLKLLFQIGPSIF